MSFYESSGTLFYWLEQRVSLWQGCEAQRGSEADLIHHQFDGKEIRMRLHHVSGGGLQGICDRRHGHMLDLPEPSLWTGVNQTSAAYVKLGMATA